MHRLSRLVALIIVAVQLCAHGADTPIPITPGGEPWLVSKLRVTDCRAVRGFVGAPVDGTLKSASWDGKVWEYPMPDCGAGVGYGYNRGDGLHITLADDQGFNAVVVRGGIKARLVRDATQYDQSSGTLVCEFPGKAKNSHAWFDVPVKTSRISFFDVGDGVIGDASLFRVRRGTMDATPQPLTDQPLSKETGVAAVGVEFDIEAPRKVTIGVQDPLTPRLQLHCADYAITQAGHVHVICEFPHQVVPAGTRIVVSIGGKPKTQKFELYEIPVERARPEALEYRKFILHALYTPISEARPWNVWNNPGDEEKYFARPADTGDALQDRLRPFVREIVMTLDQCRALDPDGKDEVVRQFHQWMRRKMITKSTEGMPPFPTKFDRIDGAPPIPEWASLVHQAWMQAREVPRWWIERRMTPNGEFGGLVADDSDMQGNYAPFPFLERGPADGNCVGGQILDAAARLAELAEKENLQLGVNKQSMDPLHAYEEGMNLEAELAYWNYGDPIYLERCMAAARSTEPMTVVTDKGHRHFRNNDLGVKDVSSPGPLEGEHGTHCLMWHPALVVGWYNRNPLAMKWLSEWGDGWLDHMPPYPAEQGHAIKLPEDVTSKTDPLPFSGGWGMTGSVFTFLADLTGDARFVRPYVEYFAGAKKNTGFHFAELLQMGMLPPPAAAIADPPWNATLYTTGDKKPFIEAIKKDIEELQRFPYMYTQVECFTDRVFLYAIINPSIAYTGGYTTRNKLNLTYAISYQGLGTDYAALVTSATSRHLKVLLCNLSDKPIAGRARLWRLEPGEYELTMGPDADNDDTADRIERKEKREIVKGDEIAIALAPKVVQVLEVKQLTKAAPLFDRADLAVTARELKRENGKITGVIHNIGCKDVDDVVVALLDDSGRAVQTKHLGRLEAPLDLRPRLLRFELDAPPASANGGSVVVDPQNLVPEICETNNRAPLP
jgi:hypothetical protein